MKNLRKSVIWAINAVLIAAVVAWIFFTFAVFSDIAVEIGYSGQELYGPEAVQLFRWSTYLLFFAIALLAIGALFAQKRLAALLANADGDSQISPLAKPAHEFANTVIIISLVLAAWAAIGVFMQSFFEQSNAENMTLRILGTYLPIALYAILVVGLLLSAFVFSKRPKASSADHAAPISESFTVNADENRRNIGLAFAVPIVAVAFALILGLIVFDVSATTYQVWIWVIIQVLIGSGIVTGSWFAAKSIRELRVVSSKPIGAAVGAKNLNFVLSIIFAAVLTFMSLIYGSMSMEQLRVAPNLSVTVFSQEEGKQLEPGTQLEVSGLTISVNGNDLKRGSTTQIELVGSSGAVSTAKVDSEGNVSQEVDFPKVTEAGTYTLTITGVAPDDEVVEAQVSVVANSASMVSFPDGADRWVSSENSGNRMQGLTWEWFFTDYLPSVLLLMLAATSILLTLLIRNPESVNGRREN